MDEASVQALSSARLALTVYLCLRELCRRCGIGINEQSTVTVRFGSPEVEQPSTPPGHFLCCLTCEQCAQYCCSRNPNHTAHFCRRHQPSSSRTYIDMPILSSPHLFHRGFSSGPELDIIDLFGGDSYTELTWVFQQVQSNMMMGCNNQVLRWLLAM